MIDIDARGLGCPIPVVRTKQAMEAHPAELLRVLVDAEVAKENVSRLARSRNYEVLVAEESGEEYRLVLKPGNK